MNAKQILSALLLTALLAVPLVPAQSPLRAVRCADNVVIDLIQRDSALDPIPCIQQAVCPMPTTTPSTTACGIQVCGKTGKDTDTVRICGDTPPAGPPAVTTFGTPPTDGKGYVVIPWNEAPLVRAVPTANAEGKIAILFLPPSGQRLPERH